MKTATKKPTKRKSPAEQIEELRRRIWLQASAFRGEAARLELCGAEIGDGRVCALHNCAIELDALLAKEA